MCPPPHISPRWQTQHPQWGRGLTLAKGTTWADGSVRKGLITAGTTSFRPRTVLWFLTQPMYQNHQWGDSTFNTGSWARSRPTESEFLGTDHKSLHFQKPMGNSWRRKWQPTPLFLPGESQRWQSLVGCCPWGLKELHMTEVT